MEWQVKQSSKVRHEIKIERAKGKTVSDAKKEAEYLFCPFMYHYNSVFGLSSPPTAKNG